MKVNNISILTQKGMISNELLVLISNLTLEELIAIKIELSASNLNNKLYGIPIWKAIPNIAREALFKVAHSITKSNLEGARFLGLTNEEYYVKMRKYGIK
jgi:hypothetical protein